MTIFHMFQDRFLSLADLSIPTTPPPPPPPPFLSLCLKYKLRVNFERRCSRDAHFVPVLSVSETKNLPLRRECMYKHERGYIFPQS